MKKNNIVLIGMPGSGKSTIGVILAKKMAFQFLDSDLVIQERSGKRLQEIIAEEGNAAFSKLENEVNASLETDRTVIATGGSAVYWEESMKHFKEMATVVYIRTSYDELVSRIKDFKTRGIYVPEGQTFLDIYNDRVPLYEAYADVTVDSGDGPTWETVERMYSAIEEFWSGINE